MSLLDKTVRLSITKLPSEILHLIFVQAALSRGVKRALRLRLVCKTFADAVHPALFETHLMDGKWNRVLLYIGSYQWQLDVGSKYGAEKLWHKYLVYRIMDRRDQTVERFVQIRRLAQEICQEMEREKAMALNLRAIVEDLCWLALRKGNSTREYDWENNPKLIAKPELRTSLGLNLLSAAAHFDLLPFAKRLVAEGHSPTSHTELFASPIQIAAQAGNVTMLQFFQEQLPESSHFEPYSVIGAAIRGDLDILKLALRLPARMEEGEGRGEGSEGDDTTGQQFGSIGHETETGRSILQARSYTSCLEVYQYLTSALTPLSPLLQYNMYTDLQNYAQLGDMFMVRYLLDLGVPVQGYSGQGTWETPLVTACRGWREDIVDLLLERGAYPNFVAEFTWPLFPLHESETAGNLSIARKLLDHGALTDRAGQGAGGRLPVLFWAFAREHTEMIQLLLERGASFSGPEGRGRIGTYTAGMTYHLGYDSMAEILRRECGYYVTEPPVWPRRGLGYHHWNEAVMIRSRQ